MDRDSKTRDSQRHWRSGRPFWLFALAVSLTLVLLVNTELRRPPRIGEVLPAPPPSKSRGQVDTVSRVRTSQPVTRSQLNAAHGERIATHAHNSRKSLASSPSGTLRKVSTLARTAAKATFKPTVVMRTQARLEHTKVPGVVITRPKQPKLQPNRHQDGEIGVKKPTALYPSKPKPTIHAAATRRPVTIAQRPPTTSPPKPTTFLDNRYLLPVDRPGHAAAAPAVNIQRNPEKLPPTPAIKTHPPLPQLPTKAAPRSNERLKSPKNSACFRLLLIIIFNRPHFYGNIPFLKSLYKDVFKHIVFYGPPPVVPEVRSSLDLSGGFFQQVTAVRAMKDYPNFDGYLWIGDDVWLNYPQLLSQMDLNKIWLNPKNQTNYIEPHKYINTGWGNWAAGFGLPALRNHYASIPHKFLQQTKYAFGEENKVIKSFSDVVYVPQRFVADFITVASLLPDVIFEIAIPTALHLISKKEDHQYFSDALYLWYDGKRAHVWDFWSTKRSFIHPVKLGDRRLRDFSTKWSKQCERELNFKRPEKLNC